MVAPKSSPSAPRPQAPALMFAPPPEEQHQQAVAAAPPEIEADTGRDDMSVPPVDMDSHFFDAGADPAESMAELEARDPRAAMKRTAAAASRRAHLTKYVTATMAVASALLIAALVKGAVGHAEARSAEAPAVSGGVSGVAAASVAMNTARTMDPAAGPVPGPSEVLPPPVANSAPTWGAPQGASAATEAPTQVVPAQPVPAQAEAPAPAAPPAPAAEPVTAAAVSPLPPLAAAAPSVQLPAAEPAPAAAAPAPVVAAAPVATTASGAVPAADAPAAPKPAARAADATQEKERSRGALERGRVYDAIASGERAVAMDPGDAEAWLILGAAYQQKGDTKNASRSFKACVDQGKRGPKAECAAMLHQ